MEEVINAEFPECSGPFGKIVVAQFCLFNIGGWMTKSGETPKEVPESTFSDKEFEEPDD